MAGKRAAGLSREVRLSSDVLCLFGFLLLVLLAYVPVLDASFIFDDENDLVLNDDMRNFAGLRWLTTSRRPFASLTFALNFLVGDSPAGFRAVNIAIHLLSFVAAYLLLSVLLRAPRLGDRYQGLAAPVAGLWAIHPLHTSAVTYIIHRFEALTGSLSLLALYFFFRHAESKRGRHLALSTVFCLLAGLSKESAVTLPVVALVLEWSLYGRPLGSLLREKGASYAALGAVLLPLLLLFFGLPSYESQRFDNAALSAIDYARSEPAALFHYLKLSLWPSPLSVDYYDWPVVRSLRDLSVAGATTLAAIPLVLVLLARRSLFALPFGVALIYLAPTSSFIPLRFELVAERRMYLPLLALLVPVAYGVRTLVNSSLPSASRLVLPGLVALTGVTLTCLTLHRNSDYLDPVVLYEKEVAARPENPRSRAFLGQYLARAEEYDRAWSELRKAYALDPKVPGLVGQLAFVAHRLGLHEEAANYARELYRREPEQVQSLVALTLTLPRIGRGAELLALLEARASAGTLEATFFESLTYFLATVPERRDGLRSLDYAERLRGGFGDTPRVRELRALALAAVGRYEDALATLPSEGTDNVRLSAERRAFLARRPFDYEDEWR